jgi:RecA-family ATPase
MIPGVPKIMFNYVHWHSKIVREKEIKSVGKKINANKKEKFREQHASQYTRFSCPVIIHCTKVHCEPLSKKARKEKKSKM